MTAQKLLLNIAKVKLTEIKDRLDKEVSQSSNKKHVADLFVKLLGEWLTKDSGKDLAKEEAQILRHVYPDLDERRKKYISQLEESLPQKRKVADPDFSIVDEVFEVDDSDSRCPMRSLIDAVERYSDRILITPVTDIEVKAAFRAITVGRLLRPEDVARSEQVLKDDELVKEYASLLTILMKHLDKWEWDGGQTMKVHWFAAQEKFRGILCYDVEQGLLLQVLAKRWIKLLNEHLLKLWREDLVSDENTDQRLRGYYNFLESRAENEMFLMSLKSAGSGYNQVDESDDEDKKDKKTHQESCLSLLETCLAWFKHYAETTGEIDGVTVGVSDVKKLCHSVSHGFVEKVARTLGFTDQWIVFFRKLFSPQFTIEGGQKVIKQRSGLLMAHEFTKLFAEIAMYICDWKVHEETGVYLWRNHDDILFWDPDETRVGKAFEVLRETLGRLGLEMNDSKSGHVRIPLEANDETKKILADLSASNLLLPAPKPAFPDAKPPPKGPVLLQMLQLTEDGSLVVDSEKMARWEKRLKYQLNQPITEASVLSIVNCYNAHCNNLLSQLGLRTFSHAWINEQHASILVDVFRRTHMNPTGPGSKTLVEQLRQRIKTMWPGTSDECLIDAWFYWPIRAGGLALMNPYIKAEQILATAVRYERSLFSDKSIAVPFGFAEWEKDQRTKLKIKPSKHISSPSKLPPNWTKIQVVDLDGDNQSQTAYYNTKTNKAQKQMPSWVGNYDFEECRKFNSKTNRWHSNTQRELSSRFQALPRETGPSKDDELREWIKQFAKRSEKWQGAGNTGETSNLGPYYTEVIKRNGKILLDVFGEFGMIPPDLVPHALIWQVLRSFKNYAGADGDNAGEWVNLGEAI